MGQLRGVNDPSRVKTKGTARANDASLKKGLKWRKCIKCGRLSHRLTRCPNATRASASVDAIPSGEQSEVE
ncbi:hypothetical protein PIB30_079124, partial [Stylosanthes scabra]|nr:hypothetical protein [Stylosanthes scabra]